jgi:hypothetical protein
MITEQQYGTAAATIRCEVPAIKAVDAVESNGGGMIDGKPVILFEPHIFWKELRERGIDPNKHTKGNSDILYPVWGTVPYPRGQAAQWARLDRAVKIHREAALESCSWGRYQICGFNHKLVGCPTVQDFVNRMYKGDAEHLMMFVQYVKAVKLDDELQNKDWAGFARGYNGPAYTKNKYDVKLKAAYLKAKGA